MPDPYKGTRGQAVNYIPTLIEEGLSNSQIVDFLKLNDLGYRTQYMYQDINRMRLESFGAAEISRLTVYDPVPEKFMKAWHGDTTYGYRVVIEYEYFDTNALDTKKTGTTIYYDHAPSQEEVLRDWEIRRQTIENTYSQVQQVYKETKVSYFRNEK